MEIEYKGANCITISSKSVTVVTDPKLSLVGMKDVKIKHAIQLGTEAEFLVPDATQRLIIEGPGEYEVADVSIKGVPAVRHIDTNEEKNTTMYRVDFAGTRIAILGHIQANVSDEQLESLGTIDILTVPVGGNGYTLDGHAAAAIARRIGPKLVIPTHYADEKLSYEVPQASLETFIKELGASHEVTPKLKIKNGILPEMMTLVELTRTT